MTSRGRFELWLNPGRHAGNISQWVEPGRYEKETHQLAWLAWQAAERSAIERAIEIVKHYEVSVGNSRAGEIACEMTMNNLRDIRDKLKELLNEQH